MKQDVPHESEKRYIMPPTGGETGDRNFELDGQLWYWNRQTRLGKAFDSSTGFRLPKGGTRSPDVAWVSMERWGALTPAERKKFLFLHKWIIWISSVIREKANHEKTPNWGFLT